MNVCRANSPLELIRILAIVTFHPTFLLVLLLIMPFFRKTSATLAFSSHFTLNYSQFFFLFSVNGAYFHSPFFYKRNKYQFWFTLTSIFLLLKFLFYFHKIEFTYRKIFKQIFISYSVIFVKYYTHKKSKSSDLMQVSSGDSKRWRNLDGIWKQFFWVNKNEIVKIHIPCLPSLLFSLFPFNSHFYFFRFIFNCLFIMLYRNLRLNGKFCDLIFFFALENFSSRFL